MILKLLMAWAGGYLLGSIPPGIFWARVIKHIDVRDHGSGRTGGSNVWRSAGFLAAFLTSACDALKGAAAIWVARALGLDPWAIAIAGALSIVGHNYSIYLGFKGGAGTMTSVGVAAALWPWTLPMLVGGGLIAVLLVGHTSVSSILVAIALPIIFTARGDIPSAVGFGIITMALTLWSLRPNIKRLLKREERFIPLYWEKPPLIRISRHPADQKSTPKVQTS